MNKLGSNAKQEGQFMIGLGVLMLIFCSLMALSSAMKIQQDQWPTDCVISTDGRVVPSKVLDGVVLETGNAVFVHSANASDASLGYCGKGSCNNTLPSILNGKHGQPVHAEYCGQKLSRVIFDGKEIFFALPTKVSPSSSVASVLFAALFIPALFFIHGAYLLRKANREADQKNG